MNNSHHFPFEVQMWVTDFGGYWDSIVSYHKFADALCFVRERRYRYWRIKNRLDFRTLACSK